MKNQLLSCQNLPVSIFQLQSDSNTVEINIPCFPISNLSAIWNNNIVFTNFDEGIFATRCPTNSRKIFYMWNLDWQNCGYSKEIMDEVIGKSDYVFVRDESYMRPIQSFFGRMCDGINKDFDLERFCEL